jgi:tetratricopeptide (TPR) repeat protein
LRALEINDSLADAHSLYGDILTWYDWNFQLAEVEYRRTMALDPLNVLGYAVFLSSQSRHNEAIELVNARLAAAPDDDYVKINAGWNFLRAGRYSDAIDIALQVRNHPDTQSLLGLSYLHSGDANAAVAAFEEDIKGKGRGTNQIGHLAYAYFKLGDPTMAQVYLDELLVQAEAGFVSPTMLASIYFASGNDARGYELLESAVEVRERSVIFLNVSPSFSDHRKDPRFVEILERVGFVVDEI